jgi:thermitase
MNRIITKLFSIFTVVLFFIPQIGYAVPTEITNGTEREIVVYTGKSQNKFKKLGNDIKRKNDRFGDLGIYTVSESEIPKLKLAKAKGEIKAYSSNEKYRVALTPSDPGYSSQWALPKIDAPEAWDITTGSNTVTVAVIDTGVQLSHEDLAGRFVAGHDFLASSPDVSDPSLSPFVETCVPPQSADGAYNHGTMISGVIAANSNTTGMAGLDWQAKIMPLQVMDNCGSGDTTTIAAAINWAVINGADIINMSLGGSSGSTVLQTAINDAYNAGVTLIAAAGNEGGPVIYPAAYPDVIAVGSVGSDDVRSSFSNYGTALDIVAPGENVLTTNTIWSDGNYSTDSYAFASGTSLSTPIVAGVASLLKARDDYSPTQIRALLTNSADIVAGMGGVAPTDEYGYGRINAASALTEVLTLDISKISLNSFRITMEDTTTPLDSNDYVLATSPAVGEPVSIRATLKNDDFNDIDLTNVRIKGTLSSGTQFVVGTVPSLTLGANAITAVPVQTFNITSFYTHSFTIEYEVNSQLDSPYVKPTYTYQQVKAHYPYVKIVKTPTFVPNPIASYGTTTGVYKLKNYDTRPAYLKKAMIWAKLDKNLYYFAPEITKINPSAVYYYQKSIIPFRKGTYSAFAQITYGNGAITVPVSLLSTSGYGSFIVN